MDSNKIDNAGADLRCFDSKQIRVAYCEEISVGFSQ